MEINISNARITSMGMSGSSISLSVDATAGSQPTVHVDGQQVTGAINGQPAHTVAQAPTPPGGPTLFYGWSDTRHWQPGDGEPSQEMVAIHPEWFANKPNTAVDHNADAGASSPEVTYNTGGETKIGNTGRVFVNNCVGNSDFDMGSVAAGVPKSFSCVAAGPGDCHGDFILVDRTGTVIAEYIGHTDPTITFTGTGDDLVLHVRLARPLQRMAVVWQN